MQDVNFLLFGDKTGKFNFMPYFSPERRKFFHLYLFLFVFSMWTLKVFRAKNDFQLLFCQEKKNLFIRMPGQQGLDPGGLVDCFVFGELFLTADASRTRRVLWKPFTIFHSCSPSFFLSFSFLDKKNSSITHLVLDFITGVCLFVCVCVCVCGWVCMSVCLFIL